MKQDDALHWAGVPAPPHGISDVPNHMSLKTHHMTK